MKMALLAAALLALAGCAEDKESVLRDCMKASEVETLSGKKPQLIRSCMMKKGYHINITGCKDSTLSNAECYE